MYHLYIIECADGSLYTGITTDLKRRLKQHEDGTGARYTRARGVVRVRYSEEHPSKSQALKRELEIKGWTRRKKLEFLAGVAACIDF